MKYFRQKEVSVACRSLDPGEHMLKFHIFFLLAVFYKQEQALLFRNLIWKRWFYCDVSIENKHKLQFSSGITSSHMKL